MVNPHTVLCKRGEITRARVYVDLYEGSELIPYNDEQRGSMSCSTLTDSGRYITETIRWDFGIDTDGRFYYIITCDGSADEDVRVPFRITYKGKEYPSQLTVRTIGSGRGAVLRGPQDWEKCAVGYEFQNGAEGYDFYDVVIYKGKYYTCKTAHSKTLLNYPGGTYADNNGLWQQTWGIEAVGAILTFRCPAALTADDDRCEAATVLEHYCLLPATKCFRRCITQTVGQNPHRLLFLTGLTHIDYLDLRQTRLAESFRQGDKSIFSMSGFIIGLYGWCRGTEENFGATLGCEHDGGVARIIARSRIILLE